MKTFKALLIATVVTVLTACTDDTTREQEIYQVDKDKIVRPGNQGQGEVDKEKVVRPGNQGGN
ncbi:hypothetical protein [Croceivirga sp. JEA036]|uniref:hypothetical protein n=1 Tax=Croceivirga sp. JEA036 TaxID=2721162 RepID=UPI00143C8B17|nr:hypothetical protein [Croceivirga sp. JEA036]NJB36352.1 hypothetical protein [Croceivirga sp. JEA036]